MRTGIRTVAGDLSAPITVSVHLNMVPGAKMVQMTDRITGEVVKGVFLPITDDNGMEVRKGRPLWRLSLIPFPDGIATHVVVPYFRNQEAEDRLVRTGNSTVSKAGNIRRIGEKFGNAYVHGRIFVKDLKELDDLREKYGKKRLYTESGGADSVHGGK